MDGPFFSLLPKGDSLIHLFYHVKHSIIKTSKKNIEINDFSKSYYLKKFKKIKKYIKKDFLNYFPDVKFKLNNKFHLSRRVIQVNKNDQRCSHLNEVKKNYFSVYSGKIDHSVDIANKIKRILLRRNNHKI